MEETWKQIADADQFYEISNRGRARIASHTKNDGSIIPEHLIPPVNNGLGYIQYVIKYGGKKKKRYAHRLVADAFIPNKQMLSDVDHIDENKSNNVVENLQWLSHQDNMRKMFISKNRTKQVYYCECGNQKSEKKAIMCFSCRQKIKRLHIPPHDELLETLMRFNGNLSATGRYYNVSSASIKKWCREHQIDFHKIKGLIA